MAASKPSAFVGVDTGGTFTDVVYLDGRRSGHVKLLSTPDDPGRAVLDALGQIFGKRRADLVTYGTTVATNAMLERRGARTVLVTTAGFEDVIEIGRQARPDLYALEPQRVPPLVPAALRIGARERTLFDGTTELELDEREIERVYAAVARKRPEALAVCLLHGPAAPAAERRLARALEKLGVPVSVSHRLSPEPGEYERSSTTVANAYVRPKLEGHVRDLARASGATRFRVLQSNGGAIAAETASNEPIRTMLSGPAGGVAAAWRVASEAGFERAVTVDMGGTSTDVALLDGAIPRRSITDVGGIPIRTPCIDIHTVGAGGGSIAEIDAGGSLKVGPRSAGADPGPCCYGRGSEPTVTDANLVLGRLRADRFLGGAMDLDLEAAQRALAALARKMGIASAEDAARGVLRVIEANMDRAIRVITVERGQDPRTCALVAFGGAAALHACGLADELDMTTVLVPAHPGLLSAVGVLAGPVVRDEARALRLVDPKLPQLERAAAPLVTRLRAHLRREGFGPRATRIETAVRARYAGQSLELEVPLGRGYRRAFDELHQRLFHTSDPGRSVEVSGLRVTASAEAPLDVAALRPRLRPSASGRNTARVHAGGRWRRIPIVERDALGRRDTLEGPAIVTEYSSTVYVAAGWHLSVDKNANLLLRKGHPADSARAASRRIGSRPGAKTKGPRR